MWPAFPFSATNRGRTRYPFLKLFWCPGISNLVVKELININDENKFIGNKGKVKPSNKRVGTQVNTDQSFDSSMLSYCTPCPAELGHIGNCLCSQTLQILVLISEDFYHGLQAPEVSNCPTNLRIMGNLFENFE